MHRLSDEHVHSIALRDIMTRLRRFASKGLIEKLFVIIGQSQGCITGSNVIEGKISVFAFGQVYTNRKTIGLMGADWKSTGYPVGDIDVVIAKTKVATVKRQFRELLPESEWNLTEGKSETYAAEQCLTWIRTNALASGFGLHKIQLLVPSECYVPEDADACPDPEHFIRSWISETFDFQFCQAALFPSNDNVEPPTLWVGNELSLLRMITQLPPKGCARNRRAKYMARGFNVQVPPLISRYYQTQNALSARVRVVECEKRGEYVSNGRNIWIMSMQRQDAIDLSSKYQRMNSVLMIQEDAVEIQCPSPTTCGMNLAQFVHHHLRQKAGSVEPEIILVPNSVAPTSKKRKRETVKLMKGKKRKIASDDDDDGEYSMVKALTQRTYQPQPFIPKTWERSLASKPALPSNFFYSWKA